MPCCSPRHLSARSQLLADPVSPPSVQPGRAGAGDRDSHPGFGFRGSWGIGLIWPSLAWVELDANLAGPGTHGRGVALFIGEAFTPTLGVLVLGRARRVRRLAVSAF